VSVIDPFQKKMTTKGESITGREFLQLTEKCTYSEQEGQKSTLFHQKVKVVSSIPLASTKLCELATDIAKNKSDNSICVVEQLLMHN
jgi:hypothetical protein